MGEVAIVEGGHGGLVGSIQPAAVEHEDAGRERGGVGAGGFGVDHVDHLRGVRAVGDVALDGVFGIIDPRDGDGGLSGLGVGGGGEQEQDEGWDAP